MTTYSRQSPSPRYLQLVDLYRDLHTDGDTTLGMAAENTFNGKSLLQHVGVIGQLCRHFGAKTLLDYGSGKGQQYGPIPVRPGDGREFPDIPSFWGVQVTCFDPGHEPFSVLPDGPFDAVISTDVLEHCPEEDLEWIVGEMFARAGKFLYANAAFYLASKILPNGENAHITLQPLPWWQALFERVATRYPDVPWLLSVEERKLKEGKVVSNMRYAGSISLS